MADKQWIRSVCSRLAPLRVKSKHSVDNMSALGWRQFEAFKQNIHMLDIGNNGLEELGTYGLELSKEAYGENAYHSLFIENIRQESDRRYRETNDLLETGLTVWDRNIAKYTDQNRAMYERLRSTLDLRMEEAVTLDLDTKLENYASDFDETKSNRIKLIKSIWEDKLAPLGFTYSKSFSTARYLIGYQKALAHGYVLCFSTSMETLKRGNSEYPRDATNQFFLSVIKQGVKSEKILLQDRFLNFDFRAIFSSYPCSWFAPYVRFSDLRELEINTLANIDLYRFIHDDLVRCLTDWLDAAEYPLC